MISGLGFFEILIILLMVLMFFGSNELPKFIRESAKLIGKLRKYSDKVRRELNDATQIAEPVQTFEDEVATKKNAVRKICREKRNALSKNERHEKSKGINNFLYSLDEFKNAKTVMIFAATDKEVQTEACIKEMLEMKKRVILPFCVPDHTELGIAEIKHYPEDMEPGAFKILEPKKELQKNFFKSDLHLVLCPGLGFDKEGGRLGYGKAYYDYFLKEIKNKVTIIGFLYHCQLLDELVPFDYHDVAMDILISEEGIQRIAKS